MRLLPVTAAALGCALLGTGSGVTAYAASRQVSFGHRADALEQRWATDVSDGVAPSGIAPLRHRLESSTYSHAAFWAPLWWGDTGAAFLTDLEAGTVQVWRNSMASARATAEPVLESWRALNVQYASFVPADAARAEMSWAAQLARAPTPAAVMRMVSIWSGNVTVARNAAQFAQLNAEVAAYGGVNGLLAKAASAVSRARSDNLDPGQVPALSATLRSQVASHVDATPTLTSLVGAMQTLTTLFSLNNNVEAGLRPLLLSVDQAAAEETPDSPAFLAHDAAIAQAFQAAADASALGAVAEQIAALTTAVATELSADQCGHAVPAGRVITLNLTLQEAVFYQDGCAVQATPITTGRANLRTPTGTFHVFKKASPWLMVSPWPQGSPYWYPNTLVSWVMEFAGGGYFLHDASWEPLSMYGPGSENTWAASHGCVHIPTAVMQWAYTWTPMDTPVIVSS